MDSIYMKSAIAEAEKAYAEGETPVGAVIVRDGGIIASAHNMTERLNDSTAHAELLAIQAAEKATGDRRLTGCALYVTMEPCPMCAGAALNSRIEEIVFGAWDPEMGSCGSRTDAQGKNNGRCAGRGLSAASKGLFQGKTGQIAGLLCTYHELSAEYICF